MTITRKRVFVPVPRLDIGGLVTALLPWGTHKPASRVIGVRGRQSGYCGIPGYLKPYDAMTKAEHEACARFFGGHLED